MGAKVLFEFLHRLARDHEFRKQAREVGQGRDLEEFAAKHGYDVSSRALTTLRIGLSEDGQMSLDMLEEAVDDGAEASLSVEELQELLEEHLDPEERRRVADYIGELKKR